MAVKMINHENSQETQPLTLVVIGASAGGLEVLSEIISNLPETTQFAYLIVQHLSPDRPTLLPDILEKLTTIDVIEVKNGMKIKKGNIYISPEAKNVEVTAEHKFLLTKPLKSKSSPSIDLLFASGARIFKEYCIGVILSGSGRDGAVGMREIHSEGGFTIVQEPTSAKFDGMPLASIEGCAIDAILRPNQISEELQLIEDFSIPKVISQHKTEHHSLDDRARILELLHKHKKVDFSVYKETTINRRIERRMIATKTTNLHSYREVLEATPNEVAMLYEDILIGVTQFFRDDQAFKSFAKAMESYIEKKPEVDELRIWIPGCSTGEEVYSVLIIINELLESLKSNMRIKIFATDINEESLDFARRGAYSRKSLESFDESLIKKYFEPEGGLCAVKKHFRESVVFAFQNLLADPPFRNMDLIVCRNLLIYFKAEAQNYVIPLFHKSLRPNGILFLGKSENSSYYDDWFIEIDAKNKIFKHIPSAKVKKAYAMLKSPRKSTHNVNHGQSLSNLSMTLNEVVAEEVNQLFLPQLVVTNSKMEVVFKKGNLQYLKMPDGYMSYNLYKMITPNLSVEIRKAVLECRKEQQKVSTKFVLLSNENISPKLVRAIVIPLVFNREEMLAVGFEEIEVGDLDVLKSWNDDQNFDKDSALSIELKNTKQNMQVLVDELETSNVEYQTLNEELQSSNEEFQSTNEELETSIEELQSTNEELQTAYVELKEMFKEKNIAQKALERMNSRYDSLLENINDAVVTSNIEGEFIRVNKAMQSITGYSKKQLLTKKWSDLIDGVDNEQLKDRYKILLKQGSSTPYTVTLIAKDKTSKIVCLEDYITRDKDGSIQVWSFANDVTEEQQAKQKVQLSEKKYQLMFEQANIGIAHVSLDGEWIRVNPALCSILGYSEDELLSRAFQDITYPEDLEIDLDLVEQMIQGEIKEYKLEKRYFNKAGEIVWANLSVGLIRDLDGKPSYFVSIIEDISEQKDNLLKLEQAYVVFNSTQEAIIVTDLDFKITRVNQAFESVTGYLASEVLGEDVSMLGSEQQSPEINESLRQSLQQHGSWSGEVVNRYKDGKPYSVYLTVNTVSNTKGEIVEYVGVLTDISTLKAAQKETAYLAYHDTLTGLPNRALCIERLQHSIAQAKRDKNDLALLFIDLDRFKVINDGLGHSIGDKVLVEAAKRLQVTLREQDTLARLGGDEFVAIIDGLASPLTASNVAEKLIESISKPFNIEGNKIKAGASIGISVYPNDGADFETLLRKADLAMYLAKDQGRNTYRFVSEGLSDSALEKVTIEHSIQDALDKREFEVYYQPIVDLQNRQVISLEALIRWNHPKLGIISPGKFIPVAEESDLIVQITQYVTKEVIRDIKELKELHGFKGKVAINLSVKEFESKKFVDVLHKLCEEMPILNSMLQFEITERLIMPEGEMLKNRLNQVKDLGFDFIIDDFGTGYSNLKYLTSMPIKALKIDMCFVKEIGVDSSSEEIIKATIAMANALNLYVVAEGIETKEQFEFLKQNGCTYGQGYLFSRPQSLKRTCQYLNELA